MENKLNVVNIITGTDNGGGGEYVLNICRSNIFKSSLICIGEGDLYCKAIEQNINVKMLTVKEILSNGLTRYIEENNIDIVIWHGAKGFFIHSIVKKKLTAKSIATVHSDFNTDFLNNKIKKVIFTKLSYSGLKSFDNYIAVSTEISNLIKENFKYDNIFIVRNGIDCNLDKSIKKIHRNEIGLSEDDFVFMNIARLHPVKNHITLLKGFKELLKRYSNCKMVLIGGGSEKDKIEDFILANNLGNSVIMLGEKKSAVNYLSVCDANILSSINEGGEPPIVILEGAIMNKPTLCSDINRLKEIITEERGYTFDPNDEKSIYIAMESCINDKLREEKAYSFKEYKEIFEKLI